jgi:acyl carrier protein phosphodiesterase
MVRQSARRLRASHGKYAPVILDVLHDYLLANNWSRYSEKKIGEFAASVYAVLQKHLDLMPVYLQQRLPLMIAEDWLVRYGTDDGLAFTFSRMQLRSGYPVFFENAVESLHKDYAHYEAEFHAFFPELIEFSRTNP